MMVRSESHAHIRLCYLVRRGGIEPPESVTPDLQSGPLPSTKYRRMNKVERQDLNLHTSDEVLGSQPSASTISPLTTHKQELSDLNTHQSGWSRLDYHYPKLLFRKINFLYFYRHKCLSKNDNLDKEI